MVAERRERPRGAAELRGEAVVADRDEAFARLLQRHEPAGDLEPERRRQRLLEEGPATIGVERCLRELGQPALDGREIRENEVERAARDEHRRGVHDVLARRAAVD